MADGHAGLHEAEEKLSPKTKDLHRALISLQEELEAVDWYQQRAEATEDKELKKILEHNRDEEKEHALMLMEWIRRRDEKFDSLMRTYIFTETEITEIEESATGGSKT